MFPTGCRETSVTNYQSTLRKFPEERTLMITCFSVAGYQTFGGICCLPLQGKNETLVYMYQITFANVPEDSNLIILCRVDVASHKISFIPDQNVGITVFHAHRYFDSSRTFFVC